MEAPPKDSDAVVVGGGVVGLSIAYHLAKEGLRVVLAEKNFIGAGTSAATFAWVGAHQKSPLFYHRFSREGIDHCERISEELGVDIEFARRGSLCFLLENDFQKAETEVPQLQAQGYDLRLLGLEELFKLEPYAGKLAGQDLAGATFCPSDAEVNPLLLLRAYARKARELGVGIFRQTSVTQIHLKGNRVQGVGTNRGEVRAPIVVNAAGPGAAGVARLAGVEIPMNVTRGQVLVTEKLPPILNHLHSGLRQSRSGNLIVGMTHEPTHGDTRNTYDGIADVSRRLLGAMPILKQVRILRAYAGLRPMPDDGHPIIDTAEGAEGFYTAVMHSGITLSARVGHLVSQWIATGERPLALEPYRLSRFPEARARAG